MCGGGGCVCVCMCVYMCLLGGNMGKAGRAGMVGDEDEKVCWGQIMKDA